LAELDIRITHQTVKNILEDHGIDPAPQRKGKTSWSDFIKSHTDSMLRPCHAPLVPPSAD
jgi:hypothetical protein